MVAEDGEHRNVKLFLKETIQRKNGIPIFRYTGVPNLVTNNIACEVHILEVLGLRLSDGFFD